MGLKLVIYYYSEIFLSMVILLVSTQNAWKVVLFVIYFCKYQLYFKYCFCRKWTYWWFDQGIVIVVRVYSYVIDLLYWPQQQEPIQIKEYYPKNITDMYRGYWSPANISTNLGCIGFDKLSGTLVYTLTNKKTSFAGIDSVEVPKFPGKFLSD